MKLFNLILISSNLPARCAYPKGAQDYRAPFHLLYFRYSKPHNHMPRNTSLNVAFPRWKFPAGVASMRVPINFFTKWRLTSNNSRYYARIRT